MFQLHRRILAWTLPWILLFGTAGIARAEVGITDSEILIGQSLGLTGPLAELTKDIENGARAYVSAINAKGGIHGRRLRLITMDDGYQVPNTVKNVEQMIERDKVFALLNVTGTPNCEAILPAVQKSQVPFFAPFTGAVSTRKPMIENVFNVRASYRDETEKLVQHLHTIGIQKIAVVYQASSFGKDGLAGVEAAMAQRGIKAHGTASIESNASDVAKSVDALAAGKPEAIIMITAGRPTVEFIKSYRKVSRGVQFYSLSVMGTNANLKALGSDGVGVVVASVVPFPWNKSIALVGDYQAAMQKIGITEYSFVSLEGYINARILGEAIERAGRDLTRSGLVKAAEGMTQVGLGGFNVRFGRESRQASKHVELTIIGRNGKFIK
jgi:branched-chain amino acid transport system substrate-binding protein